ncbi:hypothetical protein LSTR_LSTR007035 [Laodelphax striatellus]|uniref:Uncharacterized protein n=1 Tax=Laodelphax striatellus TaxID=195883 RepID=A0A482WJF4_LAOST|nr:hypothetical protein LSTR_LSTR007035 [Laodelphax striatellus]
MPIAPHLGKALIYAVLLNCLDPVLTVVAMLSYDDPFVAASSDSARSHELLVRRFMGGLSQSDHCGLLRVYMRWLEACSRGQGRAFCDGNRLSEARLKLVYRLRQQLLTQLRSAGLVRNYAGAMRDLNANSESLTVVKAALTAGHYPNLARVDRQMNAIRTRDEVSVTFHPSSLLRCDQPQDFPAKLATECGVFEEKRQGSCASAPLSLI